MRAAAMRGRAAPAHNGGADNKGVFILYVSVFLLLLAFFILLNSMATLQKQRAGQVRQSVEAAFGLIPLPVSGQVNAEALAGAARTVEQLGDLFVSEIAVAKIEATGRRGRTLVVTLPLRTLFVGDESVRPETAGLLTRVADALSSSEGGAEIRLEFLVSTQDSPGEGEDPVALNRAAAFATALAEAGAPPARVTVGLEKGEDGWARLLFTVTDAVPAAGASAVGASAAGASAVGGSAAGSSAGGAAP